MLAGLVESLAAGEFINRPTFVCAHINEFPHMHPYTECYISVLL